MDRLPLDGVQIAEFSWQIAGPTCTPYLGALGAEVIRIESNRRPIPTGSAASASSSIKTNRALPWTWPSQKAWR